MRVGKKERPQVCSVLDVAQVGLYLLLRVRKTLPKALGMESPVM